MNIEDAKTLTNLPPSDLAPLEQLKAIAIRTFPKAPRLPLVSVIGDIKEVWLALAEAADVSTFDFASAISQTLGLEAAQELIPDTQALSKFPSSLARQELLLPLKDEENKMIIASCLPFQTDGISRARFVCGKPIEIVIAPPDVIEEALQKAYMELAEKSANRVSSALAEKSKATTNTKSASATENLVQALLTSAVEKRASDIHLKPFLRGSEIRFRIDGVLQRITLLPDGVGSRVIRYFKAHGDMNPTISHLPQDGRMSFSANDRQFDLRISILPASGGENLVVRFLEQGRIYSLSNTGLSLLARQTIRKMLSNVSGLILMTGPTGSGKSTTLYSMIAEINSIGINITTIENPVEYRVSGLTQVEVNVKAGLTFPSVIRSCMRQDPDVILIGEIRDTETAQVALQAAVTGHLVLSTLHTNDAVTTVSRLAGLGVNATVLADALIGSIAQRLVRKLCEKCRIKIEENDLNSEEQLFKTLTNITPTYRACGCGACQNSGYSGRIPVVEIFENSPEIAEMISEGNISRQQLQLANQGQLTSLAGSVSRLIVSGETCVSEALRVIGRDFWSNLAHEYGTQAPLNTPILSEQQHAQTAVLIISSDQSFIENMSSELTQNNIESYSCQTPAEANELLHVHEQICFVVVDLDERSDEENVEYVHNARITMYWSYLPALLLLPKGHTELKQKLVADGAVSEMLFKPVEAAFVYSRLKAYSEK